LGYIQERLGSPEGELALAQAVIFLACAPKSNACYLAFKQATDFVKKQQSVPISIPLHLRNAPTSLLKDLNYGKEYCYPHDYPNGYVPEEHYFPDQIKPVSFYQPTERGLEKQIKEKLVFLKSLNS